MLFWLTLSSEYQSADDQVAVRHDQWTTTCLVPLAIYSGSIFWARQRIESGAARLVRAGVCALIASLAEYNEEGTKLIFPNFTSFLLPRKNRDWSIPVLAWYTEYLTPRTVDYKGFDSRQNKEIFPSSKASNLTLESTQPHIQCLITSMECSG